MRQFIRKSVSMALFLLMGMVAMAQTKTVKGQVLDELGEPVIGANVIVKGTSRGTITDVDGSFTLNNVPVKGTLRVTFMGYADKEVSVNNKSVVKVTLSEDFDQLEELVVVGYGTMKKTDLTGSVSTIGTIKLNEKGALSVLENLQGSVPGVNITKSSGRASTGMDIEIRGKNSISGSQKPLYVVDGVICSDIDFLNPQDIERLDVLKDASSTAIYGSRATAGVVMVTTKSGTSAKNQKPTISYDGYYGISKIARMPDFQDADEFYDYRFMKFLTFENEFNGTPVMDNTDLGRCLLIDRKSGIYRMKELIANGQTCNWRDFVLQDGSQQNHYLSINGSTEKTSYHFGVGYSSEEGTYKNDSQDKFNFKGSVDAEINKYISAGFNVNLARINHDYASDEAVSNSFRANPYMQPYDENGELNYRPGSKETLNTDEYQFTNAINPLIYMDDQTSNRLKWNALANMYIQIKPMKDLTFKSTFSPTFSYERYGFYQGTAVGQTQNTAKRTTSQGFSWTWDNVLTYDHTFNDDHHVNVMGLFSSSYSNGESENLVYNNVLDGTYWWALGTTNQGYNYGSSYTGYSETSLISYALRANYAYKGRYMVTGTVRWDGSSKFADGNRWASFPSVALAWRVSEENFMQNTKDWLSNLKVRLSYGVTGNNNVSNYATMLTVAGPVYYPFGSTYYQGMYPNGIVDKDLQWERSEEYNVGLDFGFLNDRIRGTIDWYRKKSTDLLYDVKLPLEAGGISMKTNVGSVRNTGLEIGLTTENIVTDDWHWSTTFSYAHNDNEVLEINGTGDLYSGSSTGNLFIGQPYNNIYGYQWVGIVNDKNMIVPDHEIARQMGFEPGSEVKQAEYYNKCYGLIEGNPIIKDVDGDGRYTDADKKVYKSDPAWTGSVTSNLSYKNWDLSFSVYTKQDFTIYSNFYNSYLNLSNRGQVRLNMDWYIPAGTLIDCDGINPDGTYINPKYQETTHYGSYPFPNNAVGNDGLGTPNWQGSTNSYVDGSFVKVKHITLGYTFPKNWLKKVGCSHLRLYATVTNPFVFTDYKGYDPEWANSSLSSDGPSTVTWQFGANIKF